MSVTLVFGGVVLQALRMTDMSRTVELSDSLFNSTALYLLFGIEITKGIISYFGFLTIVALPELYCLRVVLQMCQR